MQKHEPETLKDINEHEADIAKEKENNIAVDNNSSMEESINSIIKHYDTLRDKGYSRRSARRQLIKKVTKK